MKIKIAAGCQNESSNAVISAVGPREEPFIGKFYKMDKNNAFYNSQICMQYIQCMYLFSSV